MNTAVMLEAQELPPVDASLSEEPLARPVEELPLGTCIQGKYVIHGVLGHGGFAVVYDAEHLGLARRVAIKVLHLYADTPLALIERFHREARISALVRHPNVLEVYDTGTLPDGSPFLVMERVEGETLTVAIDRGPLPIALVVELGCQLLRGVEAIAEVGVVHRDIKPDNVMLHLPSDGAPSVKLVDFGISKQVAIEAAPRLTCVGALVGTPQYMSPEQIRGEEVDVRSDLYAIGAVLYEALTRHAPHESASFSELVVAVLNNHIAPPSELRPNCPAALEAVVSKALARSRERRYQTPREMLAELDSVAEQHSLPRGEEAFYTPDPAELAQLPRRVRACDTITLVRRLWPVRASLSRPLQFGAAAALLIAAQGALLHLRSEPTADAATSAQATTASVAAPAAAVGASVGAEPQPAPAAAGTPVAMPLPEVTSHPDGTLPTGIAPAGAPAESTRVTSVPSPPKAESSKAADSKIAPPVTPPSAAPAPAVAATTTSATAAPASEAPAGSATVRRAWERAMQAALAELVRGRLPQAQNRYREAVSLLPSEPTGFRGLGLVSARLGDARSARSALERYLELAPRASDADAIRARLSSLR